MVKSPGLYDMEHCAEQSFHVLDPGCMRWHIMHLSSVPDRCADVMKLKECILSHQKKTDLSV